ncbi:hypothetical protein ILYODFUR_038988 [Ilyodon furcidens]|uniref:Uncharacterized protein n=1 Tax=Ilyodon furcidens TaxID=33524 RepID=A0ABV0UC14_9TELE
MSPDFDLDLSRLAQLSSLSCRSMILSFHLLRKRPKILLPSVAEVDLLHLLPLNIPACLLHAASPLIFVSQTDPPAPQASTSSSTPVILQSSLLHAYRPWILSSAPFISLNISRVRLQLGHVSFLFSALPAPSPLLGPSHRRSRCLACLQVRCITPCFSHSFSQPSATSGFFFQSSNIEY